MKKLNLLFLTTTILVLYSCSGSENVNLPETFLEKYNGTVWKTEPSAIDYDQTIFAEKYYIFKNNKDKPVISLFKYVDENCVYLSDEFKQLTPNSGTNTFSFEIDKLEIKTEYENESNLYIFSTLKDDNITLNEDRMSLTHIENYNGSSTRWDSILIKSNLSESDLSSFCPH